jgi:hypothetical protein
MLADLDYSWAKALSYRKYGHATNTMLIMFGFNNCDWNDEVNNVVNNNNNNNNNT